MTKPTTKTRALATGVPLGNACRQRRVATRRASFAACKLVGLLAALAATVPWAQAAANKAATTPVTADCAAPRTQAAMNVCAEEDFLAANATYAEQYKALQKELPATRHASLRRMQSAWLAYRTAACRFNSAPVSGGSAQGFVYWSCAARMTREHSSVLATMAACREGDLTCGRKRP